MKKSALILLAALTAGACVALSPSYRSGIQAELAKNFDEAIASYEKAALQNPKESIYRVAAERARLSARLSHLQEARPLAADGKKEEASAAYRKALSYNPRDAQIALEARQMLAPAGAPPASPAKVEFPIKLQAKNEPLQIKVPVESSLRSIFTALGRAAGVSVVFDAGFRDAPFSTDLSGLTFEQALRTLCQATKNFSRVIDERTVLVIPDDPVKRVQFEATCIRTFRLSNIAGQDVFGALTQMLRSQYTPPNVVFDKDQNTVTIRGTAEQVELAGSLISAWDKPKGEVFIDVQIMESSKSKERELGMNFSSSQIGLAYNGGGTASDSDSTSWYNLKSLALGQAGSYSVTLPSAYLQLLESDSDTKIIAQPRLRGVADQKITYKVGQKIPYPATSYVPSAAGGYADNALTSYEKIDVGIEINMTPRVHREKDVTLDAEIKVTAVTGTGYGDIPIISNREVKNVVRLKDGESQLLAGLLRDEERKVVSGIPGLKSIPGLGRLFGAETTNLEQTDVIMTITPYVIRPIAETLSEGPAIWVDVNAAGGGAPVGGMALLDRDIDPEAALASQRRRAPDSANLIALSPANLEGAAGREFRMAVNVRSDQEINALSLTVTFDPRVVGLKDASEGGLSRQAGGPPSFLKHIDPSGVCTLGFSTSQPGKGVKGGGPLATLLFAAQAPGVAVIGLSGVTGMSGTGTPIAFQTSEGRITVR